MNPLIAATIRMAAENGGLTGITIFKIGTQWQASVKFDEGWRVKIDPDPVAALQAALTPGFDRDTEEWF